MHRWNRSETIKLLSFSAIASLLVLTTGCEKEEDRKVFAAQECLDSARTESDADRCISLVDGMVSEKAYLIRCSAHFIAQGFTGQRAATAFQALKDNSASGADPMQVAMAYMVFSKNTGQHSADNAITNCQASGVTSMVRLATLAKLATVTAQLASGLGTGQDLPTSFDPSNGSFDPSAIASAISTIAASNDTTTNAVIGNLAITAQQSFCGTDSSFTSTEICANLNSAVTSGATAESIGDTLLNLLQTNN